MGCSDYFVAQSEAQQREPSRLSLPLPDPMPFDDGLDIRVHTVPLKVAEDPEPKKWKQGASDSGAQSPAEAKLSKIKSEVEELLRRVEKFKGSKKDREYLYLDDQGSILQNSISAENVHAKI
jgi:hypothetical protein